MNAEQKRAWLCVATMIASVVGYCVLLPLFGPRVAFSAFALFGIGGFGAFIGRHEQVDERDKSIARRATVAGAMVSYLTFVIGCMGTWIVVYALGDEEYVDVHLLPTITMFGAIALWFTRSVAILVLYGRRMEADDA